METDKPLIIALDGRSGAGKTSLAHALAQALATEHVSVLHVEDLYQGWDSLAETGHRLAKLVQQVRAGQPVSWHRWDWTNNTSSEEILSFTPQQVVIVEGVGSLHTSVRPFVDLGIWLDSNDDQRKKRALARDGASFEPHWQDWADQEQRYLSTQDPRQAADLILNTDSADSALAQFQRLSRFLDQSVQQFLPAHWSTPQPMQNLELPLPEDSASLFEQISADCAHAALLESTSHQQTDPLGRNRYSILALAQQPTAAILVAQAKQTSVSSGPAMLRLGSTFFDALGRIWPSAQSSHSGQTPGAPHPQWVGYMGYELKRELGTVDRSAILSDGSVRPDAQFFEPDTLLIIDHEHKSLRIHASTPLLASTAQRARSLLATVRQPAVLPIPQFSCPDSPAGYQDKVRQAKTEIREGNTYEVCLTTQLHTVVNDFSPFEAYCRLRNTSPAPFAHYLRLGTVEVASISPERFISISASGKLRAEPIKGTRPRGVDADSDLVLRHDLATHPKDRAENIMIVDLLRNDLSHYAVPGSLSVPRLCAVETYATVHQLVSTIDAQLRDQQLAAAALRETFPPGSMTGAPKLSTMNILDKLEQGRTRGLYSGAVGYLGADGSADFAVVIRTLVCDHLSDDRWQLSLGLGGAITADSDPQEEWDEVRTKSVGVLSALGATFPFQTEIIDSKR